MVKETDTRVLIHTPAQLATEFVQWAEYIQETPGVNFGVSSIDSVVIPMRPGELVSIIARPGHGKTSLLAYFAREQARRIAARNGKDDEVVVYVTWEQSAEELEAFFAGSSKFSITDVAWGRVDLEDIRRWAVKRAGVPLWVIGHGIGRAGQKAPRMTPDVVLTSIETMRKDYGVKPALMLFDYMQMIPVNQARDRIQQVTEVPIRIKELALRIGAPAIVGVQASRAVDSRMEKIPQMQDAQWASSIEQTSDKIFSLWRPYQTEDRGKRIKFGEREIEVTENLLILRLLKQRGDRGRHTWAMYFDPAYLKLAELDTRQEEAKEWPADY